VRTLCVKLDVSTFAGGSSVAALLWFAEGHLAEYEIAVDW